MSQSGTRIAATQREVPTHSRSCLEMIRISTILGSVASGIWRKLTVVVAGMDEDDVVVVV